MKRRCVICGNRPTDNGFGKGSFHYPKTKKEARIWQRSLNAANIPLDAIQKYCCVCIEHIPEFVNQTKMQASRMCCCTIEQQLQRPGASCSSCNPPVNVLLMTGASLPLYCGRCYNLEDKADNDPCGDTNIYVLESSFSDSGATFPDIDSTEFKMMHAIQQRQNKEQEQHPVCEIEVSEHVKDSTDVLLLERGRHPMDQCPCSCEFCVKPSPVEGSCCHLVCYPNPLPQLPPYHEQPPCGCECEQKVRQDLERVIEGQNERINLLENILCRQNNFHQVLQCKVDELYCDFSRMYPNIPRPDCSQEPIIEEPLYKTMPPGLRANANEASKHRLFDVIRTSSRRNHVIERTSSELHRVHYYLTKNSNSQYNDRTKSPEWLIEENQQPSQIG